MKQLGRFARKVVVNYDGDRAGVQAAKKSIEILLAEDLEVKVLVLPENADPDEFIRKFGVTEYQQRRAKAQPHIQFVIDQAVGERDLQRPAEKAEAVEEVLPYIRAVRSRIQKREYFLIAMDALLVGEALRRELWQTLRVGAADSAQDIRRVLKRSGVKPTVAEQCLLELLLSSENLRHMFLPRLEPDDYLDLPTAPIFKALLEIEQEGKQPDFEVLSQKLEENPSAAELLPMLMISEGNTADGESGDPQKLAEDCIDSLRLMKFDLRINELGAEMAAADRNGDAERRDSLAREYLDLTRRRSALLPSAEAARSGV